MASTSWIMPLIGIVVIYFVITKTGILKSLGSISSGSKGGGSATGSSSTTSSTPAASSTSTGGAGTPHTNTPGWYTLSGHHHCGVSSTGQFSSGCLCTDPKKCIGHSGTGSAYCAAHLEECWPTDKPDWCSYWYASDQKYCNLCQPPFKYTGPAGSGAKPCP
jgi:hypothetical protein